MVGALLALGLTLPAVARDNAFQAALRTERERPVAPRFERDAFLVTAAVSLVTLAPDGEHLAWLRGTEGDHSLWLSDTRGGAPRRVLASTDATSLLWSHDGRWLLVVSPDRLFAVAASGQAGSRVVTELGGATQRYVMDVDPTQPAAVLLREQSRNSDGAGDGNGVDVASGNTWTLWRVSLTSPAVPLTHAPNRITGFALEENGDLAYLQVAKASTLLTLQHPHPCSSAPCARALPHDEEIARRARSYKGGGERTGGERSGGDDGNDAATKEIALRCEAMHRCTLWPLLDPEGRLLFHGDIGGSLSGLQRREHGGRITTLVDDPEKKADTDELIADPSTGQPMLATYRAARVTTYAMAPNGQATVERIQARFPGKALSFQPGRTHWLIVERGGAQQGTRYHLYEPATQVMTEILSIPPGNASGSMQAAWLPEDAMATQLPFSWTASDGMRLHGSVRIPPGVDAATVPMVAMIHGGPWGNVAANDFGTGVAQFLVNRGYVVFEPNFRGSTGYGRDYLLAAKGDFGNGRVQRDIVEGVRALLAEGVGDATRVGIVGASFGGYSALVGLTWQPELFRVGVALVPPSDFAWDLTWISRTSEATALSPVFPFERWMTMVGVSPNDVARMAALHSESPLANTTRMHRPLTIIAGGADQRVALRGVLGYTASLRHRDKDVTLLVDPVAGHTQARPVAREAALYLIADTLHRHLGGAADTPPDAALRDYLKVNLRLPGK
jgi:dipeptidyl aminopeptidase/acylaminoacyl peptidase